MSALRSCLVSYRDIEGITHSVEVSASSLYEAAVLGMKAFEQTGWADHPVGCVEIVVKSPAVKHTVAIVKVTNWLRSAGSPKELRVEGEAARCVGLERLSREGWKRCSLVSFWSY